MKATKYLLTIFMAFSFVGLNAQEGTIIHHEPDTCFSNCFIPYGSFVAIDIDGNGTDDMGFLSYEGDMYSTWLDLVTFADWRAAIELPYKPFPDSIQVQLDTLQYWNDTIGGFIPIIGSPGPNITRKVFLRRQVGDDYYYAWVKTDGGWNEGHVYACVEEFAYCSIPNYPLLWGQSSLTESIKETESTAFASIYPNPTTGLVTVTGENLRQAEVFNMLGQQMLSIKSEGNELRINMAELPAGVYFVNVTEESGKKCVRKVVKE